MFTSHYTGGLQPLLWITDVTNVTDPDNFDLSPSEYLRNYPSDVVLRGMLSCMEQAPVSQYQFIVATGRKYLMTYLDGMGIQVTGSFDVATFKMKPTEHIVFVMSQHAPFERAFMPRATVERAKVESWHYIDQSRAWGGVGSALPLYGTGRTSGDCAATEEVSSLVGARVARVDTSNSSSSQANCLISRSCKVATGACDSKLRLGNKTGEVLQSSVWRGYGADRAADGIATFVCTWENKIEVGLND